MADYGLENFIRNLDYWGITDVMLPFLLVFTIVFAILQKAKVFGDDKKNLNVVVALIMGLAVVIPHVTGTYPPSYDIVDMINRALPQVSIVLIAIIMLMLMIGILGPSIEWRGGSPAGWIAVISLIIIIIIFGGAAGWWSGWDWFVNFFGTKAVSIVVLILVFGIIIWYITKEENKAPGATFMEKLGDFFKK